MRLIEVNTTEYVTMAQVNETYEFLLEGFKTFLNDFATLDEAITVPVEGDLFQQMEEISKRFEAAKRALGIVSSKRFPVGPEKQQHMSRILGNLNVIRGMMTRVAKQVASSEAQFGKAANDYEMGHDLEHKRAVGFEQEEMNVCEDCGHSPCSCMHEECPVCTREVCIC